MVVIMAALLFCCGGASIATHAFSRDFIASLTYVSIGDILQP